MGYELDFLGVGDESKSGDAIALRFGNLHGYRHEQTVVVIDGGFKSTGEKLVEHIRSHYGTEQVDVVISTHPDQDHINGLEAVLTELEVGELWIHQPWNHNKNLADKFSDGRVTDNSLGERLKESLEKAWSLIQLAEKRGITVREPFTGMQDASGCLRVLGPTQSYYEELLPDFEGMPTRAAEGLDTLAGLLKSVAAKVKRFFATWGEDQLDDDAVTSPRNNSSVITQLIIDDRRLVFTADAGIQALDQAADQIEGCLTGAELRFIQIPHHGSRRNVGPSVLNRLIGYPVTQGESRAITAIASTAKASEPKHPRKAVLNAFTHRGVRVLATRGNGICHFHDAPDRSGWSALNAEPYHFEYEDEEA